MTKRICRSIFVMVMVVMLLCMAIIISVLHSYYNTIQRNHLAVQTELVATAVATQGMPYLNKLSPSDDFRITWIDGEGAVLYDSVIDQSTMENHSDRVEYQQALEEGYGESLRTSDTLTVEMLYTARQLDDGSVIRLSTGQQTLFAFLIMMAQPIVALVLVSIFASNLLARRIARRLIEPINRLNLDDPLANETYEELTPLLRRLAELHRKLDEQLVMMSRRQKEFDMVAGFMSEGLALLGSDGTIISINHAATMLLEVDETAVGQNMMLINHIPEIHDLIRRAAQGNHVAGTYHQDDRIFQLVASPVTSRKVVVGLVLLMYDITEKNQAEQLRREFTANVSHELKTPLHSISGCAEIIKSGLVQPQDVPQFVEQIYNEAQRLVVLVNDIIGLSRLDEGADNLPKEKVDLYQLAHATAEQLEAYAQKESVTVSVVAEQISICGIPRLLQEICYNLVDNAIKYNQPGGKVTLSLHDSYRGIHLSVKDDGIGIPTEHHDRIFQRFYRVDKSHSKEIGGTGLGLSIVKHGVQLHGGTISVESSPNVGTTISLFFPHNSL